MLSARARGVLERLQITRPSELKKLTRAKLLSIRNCGRKTAGELELWATSQGAPLGGDALRAASKPPPPVASKPPPGIPTALLLDLRQVALSARAHGCLRELGVQRLGDLIGYSEAALRAHKNCGNKTVAELAALAGRLDQALGRKHPAWDRVAAEALARVRADELAALHKSLVPDLHAIEQTTSIEAEVSAAIATLAKPSDREKVERWIGWDVATSPTLKQVGHATGVTRERVRQIVALFTASQRSADLPLSKLTAALAALERAGFMSAVEAQAALQRGDFTQRTLSIAGLLRAAELFGITTALRWDLLGAGVFVGRPEELRAGTLVPRSARRLAEQWGCVTLEQLTSELNREAQTELSQASLRPLLAKVPSLRWLDEAGGWFWLGDLRHNPLLYKLDKILSVAPRIDIDELCHGIGRQYGPQVCAPPVNVLRALCEQLPDCRIEDGRVVVDLRPRQAAELLSECERVMLDIFQRHGPVLTHAEVRSHCLAAGLKYTTTSVYLGSSPILRRLDRCVYAPIGVPVQPGEIAAARRGLPRTQKAPSVVDFGWLEDGSGIWIDYRVSASMLQSGTLRVPSALRQQLYPASYQLPDAGTAEYDGAGSLRGLSGYLLRCQVRPGALLRLTLLQTSHSLFVELERPSLQPTAAE